MINNTEQKTTTISGDWSVNEIRQSVSGGQWYAAVNYLCTDTNGLLIDTYSIQYTGEEYNNWFSHYTCGTFLIDELIRHKGWNITTPESVEEDFFN